MERLQVFAVMPCYNEQDVLHDTCMSLGFGPGRTPPAFSHLLLVNNNSLDNTQSIAEKVRAAAGMENVTICFEEERGYVPARRKGNIVVNELSIGRGWSPKDVVILQVDADTAYGVDYINAVRDAFLKVPFNTMVQGTVDYPDQIKQKYKFFFDCMYEIDDEYSFLSKLDCTNDVLIDDKIASYRLSDYHFWGGYTQEFTSAGEEVYAETTRLFLRAKARGAKRLDIGGISALHSGRKIEEHPLLSFASGGFPREASWHRKCSEQMEQYHDELGIAQMVSSIPNEVIRQRRLHILALLYLLPTHVQRALGTTMKRRRDIDQFVIDHLPIKGKSSLEERPGSFLTDVFDMIAAHGDVLLSLASQARSIG
ncbi:MAG: glycosyltransferase family 2 protein [Proteobacteria bacterium]|nr:MAG: glycosyltransferase family 2 protein [Pseudomonadota bacterium]